MDKTKRLWNRNFAILWQGQLISDFGNAAFAVALGFWVLKVTGSAALMGLVEACFALPAVLLGPFAGVFADRYNRKWIIVLADFTRGVLFIIMGLTVLFNVFPFYMIFPLAILAGSFGAFFGPAISSSIPDIVSVDNLSKANSARSLSSTLTQLLGSSFGGLLYSLLTAPVLILINGLSFLYASVTQIFIKMPSRPKASDKKHIFHDIREGVAYTFGNRGIRTLVLTGMVINFFAVCGMTLLTPLFNNTPGLGVARYGYVMGTMMAGAVIGMLVLSMVKIKPTQRSTVFGLSMLAMVVAMVPIGLLRNIVWFFPLAFIAGITNAIVNVMLQTIMQTTVAAEHRGKVFGILGTVMGGLQPIAMAVSGVAGQLAGIQVAITVSFSLLVLAALPLLLDKHFKAFINTDIAVQQEAQDGTMLAPEAAGAVVEGN
jgi:MFS transporter, DHA3 family, macrolide efflux protein